MPVDDDLELIKHLRQHARRRYAPVVVIGNEACFNRVVAYYEASVNLFVRRLTESNVLEQVLQDLVNYWFGVHYHTASV